MSSTLIDHSSYTIDYSRKFGAREGTNKVLIVLPGLLGYGNVQSEPLRQKLLEKRYWILPVSYKETHWRPDLIARELAELIRRLIREGYQPTILGISLGGLLAAMIADRLTLIERRQLTVVAVDSPYGRETLKAVVELRSAGLALFGGAVPRGPLKLKLAEKALFKAMHKPVNPEHVVFPERLRSEDERRLFIEQINEARGQGLSGHSALTWYEQIVWMSGRPPRLTALRDVKRTLYIQCLPPEGSIVENGVVVQPLALKRWREAISGPHPSPAAALRSVTIGTDHCEIMNDVDAWNRVIESML